MSELVKTPETKKPWQSKTVCLAVVTAVTPLVGAAWPAAGTFLHENAEFVCTALGLAFGALRLVSAKSVSIK